MDLPLIRLIYGASNLSPSLFKKGMRTRESTRAPEEQIGIGTSASSIVPDLRF
jgi:hypothetical protein